MIKYRTETVEQKIAESVTCDVCKKEYDYKGNGVMESQEFQSIRFQGGYGSVFGDGAVMKIDICQHCLKKILGEYMVDDTPIYDGWEQK